MATILPPAKTTFWDSNGNPLAGGSVEFFIPGTTSHKRTWQNRSQTIQNTNPVILDAYGSAVIMGNGAYRQMVRDATGTLIWDQVTEEYNGQVGIVTPLGLNALDFGAVGDGISDDTAALQEALNVGGHLYLPPGTYLISDTLLMSVNHQRIEGSSNALSILLNNTADKPTLKTAPFLTGQTVANLRLARTPTAVAGGNGIEIAQSVSMATISGIISEHNYNGFVLGPTDYSLVRDCIALSNTGHGFLIRPIAQSDGACQWYLTGCLASSNAGGGYVVVTAPGATSVRLGDIQNCATFSNVGGGFAALGSASDPIYGVRIHNCFFGEDGTHEILLDTYGGQHVIDNSFIELSGPASSGIHVSANNADIKLTGLHINQARASGVYTAAGLTLITGCQITNCGQDGGGVGQPAEGNSYGINHAAGRLVVTGCCIGNTGSYTSQTFGARVWEGTYSTFVGNDFPGPKPPVFFNVLGQPSMIGNMPPGVNNLLPGALVVGQATEGAAYGPGTINTSAGILKNGVGYANP